MVYPKKEYAFYKGDNLLKIGTAEEIAEELGIKKETVSFGIVKYKKHNITQIFEKNKRALVTCVMALLGLRMVQLRLRMKTELKQKLI